MTLFNNTYQKPDKKKINDYIHIINQYESKMRSMKHKLDIKNIQIQELNEKIEGLKERFNAPKPEPELIKGEGVRQSESSEPPELTCKVCGHEAKQRRYLKNHVRNSKDAEHQAYLEELEQ